MEYDAWSGTRHDARGDAGAMHGLRADSNTLPVECGQQRSSWRTASEQQVEADPRANGTRAALHGLSVVFGRGDARSLVSTRYPRSGASTGCSLKARLLLAVCPLTPGLGTTAPPTPGQAERACKEASRWAAGVTMSERRMRAGAPAKAPSTISWSCPEALTTSDGFMTKSRRALYAILS